jgi:NTE family protein
LLALVRISGGRGPAFEPGGTSPGCGNPLSIAPPRDQIAVRRNHAMKKIGLALGGGGAKGIAHIPMLELLDELGVRPHRIAGTSIGAIMGGLYAAGRTGAQIRQLIARTVITKSDSIKSALKKKDAFKVLGLFDPDIKQRGLFKGDKFIRFLFDAIGVADFSGLKIPLRVVAADFWKSEQVVLESGDLLSAIKASMGLPGIFTPVKIGDRILIDGGGVNPLPHDLLGDCDTIIAIDVMGDIAGDATKVPHLARVVLGTFDIMQNSIIAAKLKHSPPDIYIKPAITGIDILDFHMADEIYQQAAPAVAELRHKLAKLL